jgi:hypothetical protein
LMVMSSLCIRTSNTRLLCSMAFWTCSSAVSAVRIEAFPIPELLLKLLLRDWLEWDVQTIHLFCHLLTPLKSQHPPFVPRASQHMAPTCTPYLAGHPSQLVELVEGKPACSGFASWGVKPMSGVTATCVKSSA